MINPLIENLEHLTDTQLEEKVYELGKKYWQARNPDLKYQIYNILEIYKQELYVRRQQQMNKMKNNGNSDLDGLINIS